MDEKLLNIKEVSKIVGLKKSTIYLYIQQNKFPKAKKIGKLSRWKLSDVRRWIKELN
jgi:prophage regulatory protein